MQDGQLRQVHSIEQEFLMVHPSCTPQMFAPSGPGQKSVTMGEYVRDLLLSQVG